MHYAASMPTHSGAFCHSGAKSPNLGQKGASGAKNPNLGQKGASGAKRGIWGKKPLGHSATVQSGIYSRGFDFSFSAARKTEIQDPRFP